MMDETKAVSAKSEGKIVPECSRIVSSWAGVWGLGSIKTCLGVSMIGVSAND
jgi:hypothetical protein